MMEKYKLTFKDVLKLIAAIGGLLLAIFLVFQLTNHPKTPATLEQVFAALEAQGFEPQDTTIEMHKLNPNLETSLRVEDGDFRFYFHSFSDDSYALEVSQKYRTYLRENRYHEKYNIETENRMANYAIYTIMVNSEYTLCARIGHTVIYAESSEEDAYKINKVMTEIGYFEE